MGHCFELTSWQTEEFFGPRHKITGGWHSLSRMVFSNDSENVRFGNSSSVDTPCPMLTQTFRNGKRRAFFFNDTGVYYIDPDDRTKDKVVRWQ